MKPQNPEAVIYIPDGAELSEALARTTYLGIGAHPDDLEFMCVSPIADCHGRNNRWFTGIVLTHGGGSSRGGRYADFTDQEMVRIREKEQNEAARKGEYSAIIQLKYPSESVKNLNNSPIVAELKNLISQTKTEAIYTHNLADKHTTHVATAIATIHAIRSLPKENRPETLLGAEVWRNLDWLLDNEKVVRDISKHETLMMDLMKVFDSQIAGGKSYDEATWGRKRANAVYHESHNQDHRRLQEFYMDLTPLIDNDQLSIIDFITGYTSRFENSITSTIKGIYAWK